MTFTIEQLREQWPDTGNPFPNNIGDATVIIPELVRELEERNKTVKEFVAIRAELNNEPCGDAIDRLWKEIILARNPGYGDWEYPGMAYRHLKAEFDDLTRQLRAQQVTTTNERLRAARECAEMADRYAKAFRESRDRLQENGNPGTHSEASMEVAESLAASIRREFEVPA